MMRKLQTIFFDTAADVVIPSPATVYTSLTSSFGRVTGVIFDHIRAVRQAQEEFQQKMEAVGLERLSRMTPREVLNLCA